MPIKIFGIAVAIRWIYALILFAAMGEAGLKGAELVGYLDLAHEFGAEILSGSVHGLDLARPESVRHAVIHLAVGAKRRAIRPASRRYPMS